MQHKEPQRQSVAPEGWPHGPGRGVLVREPTRGTEDALAAARGTRHWSVREGGEEVATAPCGKVRAGEGGGSHRGKRPDVLRVRTASGLLGTLPAHALPATET